MECRDSFVFYRSFFEAVSELKEKDQAAVLLAVCDYALNGNERKLSGVPSAMFKLIKPNLDANQKKFENGKKGGRPKTKAKPKQNQNESEAEEKQKQDTTETEPNVGCGMEDVGCVMLDVGGVTPNPPSPDLSAVMSAYLNKVNPSASQQSLDELKAYVESLGKDICLRAIDIALDEKKASWSYIRGILRRLEGAGVKCLADWDKQEATHQAKKQQGGFDKRNPQSSYYGNSPSSDEVKASMSLMDKILEAENYGH